MHYKLLSLLLVVALPLASVTWGSVEMSDVERALSSNPEISAQGIKALRARGPVALDELFTMRDRVRSRTSLSERPSIPLKSEDKEQLERVIDLVAGQRYASVSRLFWYTDFERAQEIARETGKPILSLRLLGKLTDELSCANSRFFRTTLYANQEVAKYLRKHFVLHWKSVRPVPVVTIDFGDGRKLKRTLTGNSIHYVLTADGRPIDALPGLYAPQSFLEGLQRAEIVATRVTTMNPAGRDVALKQYHDERLRAIAQAWQADLARVKLAVQRSKTSAAASSAKLANLHSQTDSALGKINLTAAPSVMLQFLEKETDDPMWRKIAALYRGKTELDTSSIILMNRENPPPAAAAMPLAVNKMVVERVLLRMVNQMVDRFQSDLALDTVRNEYLLHGKLHEWFSRGGAPTDVEQLNEQVYARLFLTPSSDPWLGLVNPATYTGLKNAGIVSGSVE